MSYCYAPDPAWKTLLYYKTRACIAINPPPSLSPLLYTSAERERERKREGERERGRERERESSAVETKKYNTRRMMRCSIYIRGDFLWRVTRTVENFKYSCGARAVLRKLGGRRISRNKTAVRCADLRGERENKGREALPAEF